VKWEKTVVSMDDDDACVEAFYREFASIEACVWMWSECVWMWECECVYVSGGGDNSIYGGKLVLLIGVCEQRLLLAGHHRFTV